MTPTKTLVPRKHRRWERGDDKAGGRKTWSERGEEKGEGRKEEGESNHIFANRIHMQPVTSR